MNVRGTLRGYAPACPDVFGERAQRSRASGSELVILSNSTLLKLANQSGCSFELVEELLLILEG